MEIHRRRGQCPVSPMPVRAGGVAAGQRGSTMLMVALLVPVLVGLVALAVDITRIMLVKDELRRAAEAGALAGAAGLLSGGAIDWSAAALRARDAVTQNAAAGARLNGAGVESGYWNLATTGSGSNGFAPGTAQPTGGSWAPALRVTVARDATATGQANGGPIGLFFAPVFGRALQNVTATAVAMQSAPGGVRPGTLLPTAINKCMFDLYWDAATGTPKPVSPSSPYYNRNNPFELRIGAQNQYGSCNSGQWTVFEVDGDLFGANSAGPTVISLISTGNSLSMQVGDRTYINSSGVANNVYAAVTFPKTYLVPVVNNLNKGYQTIVAFAPFRVTNSVGGNTKAIFGQFVPLSEFPGGLLPGGSTYYGTPAPPALVR